MADGQEFQYARAWFAVGFSHELAPGQVVPLEYFDQALVLYRGEDGVARVMDAFCPHLGAHLGHGGKVEGESIRCPFHAWRFDGTGRCVDIPYAQKIPSRATIHTWRVHETAGIIFVYHDEQGLPPAYPLPEIPEFSSPDWHPLQTELYLMNTQPREVFENLADCAHFPYIHDTNIDQFDVVIDGHKATQLNHAHSGTGKRVEHFHLDATYHGPTLLLTRMYGSLDNINIIMVTPINQRQIHVRFAVTVRRVEADHPSAPYVQRYIEKIRDGFLEDKQIWEHKVWRDQPVLCDGDGPIMKLRKWYRQFYQPVESPVAPGPDGSSSETSAAS